LTKRLIRAIARVPDTGKAEWLAGAEESIAFLKANAQRDEIVLCASAPAVLIHGVLAPAAQVTPADQKDLLGAHLMSTCSWSIQRAWGGGEGHRITLEPPLSHPGCKSMVGGEQIVFRRYFTGVADGPAPVELSRSSSTALICTGRRAQRVLPPRQARRYRGRDPR
jgi:hypothetical protein